jgi:hypothetical protein
VGISAPARSAAPEREDRKAPGISRIPGVLVCSGGEARSPDLTISCREISSSFVLSQKA